MSSTWGGLTRKKVQNKVTSEKRVRQMWVGGLLANGERRGKTEGVGNPDRTNLGKAPRWYLKKNKEDTGKNEKHEKFKEKKYHGGGRVWGIK